MVFRLFQAVFCAVAASAVTAATGAFGSAGGSIEQALRTERYRYDVGEPVRLVYSIRNRGDSPVSYSFATSQQFEMVIERGATRVYRLSRGKFYTQAFTSFTLKPGESRTFSIRWDQRDDNGKLVEPGRYRARVWLTPVRAKLPDTSVQFETAYTFVAPRTLTVREAVRNAEYLAYTQVRIRGTYRGQQASAGDTWCRMGPPVTRNDWIVADHTGAIYVTGRISLDPVKDVGTAVELIGRIAQTNRGQVYLVLKRATITGRSVPGSI